MLAVRSSLRVARLAGARTCGGEEAPRLRRERVFEQLKRDFLGKPDKSRAGRIDKPIASVCAALNRRPDAYTTSSCSGRAIVWFGEEPPSKRRGAPQFLPTSRVEHRPDGVGALLDFVESMPPGAQTAWLRFEPMVLDMCCRDLGAVRRLLSLARQAGLKRTAVSSPGPRLGRASRCAWRLYVQGEERLEMPLLARGRAVFPLACERTWLEGVVLRKFERNAERTQRFLRALLSEEASGVAAPASES